MIVGVRDEVRREVTAIELHAFDDFDGRLGLLAFFDSDDAVFADLEERVGEHVADGRVVVAGDRGDLAEFFLARGVDLRGHLADLGNHGFDGLANAARESHRVGSGGDHLQAFAEDRFSQHRGRGGAVARDVVRLRGGFLHQLCAEVLVRIVQFDVFGDGDAVLGHLRGAPTFVEHRVAATGAERAANGAGQFCNAGQERLASVVTKDHLFCHSGFLLSRISSCKANVRCQAGLR